QPARVPTVRPVGALEAEPHAVDHRRLEGEVLALVGGAELLPRQAQLVVRGLVRDRLAPAGERDDDVRAATVKLHGYRRKLPLFEQLRDRRAPLANAVDGGEGRRGLVRAARVGPRLQGRARRRVVHREAVARDIDVEDVTDGAGAAAAGRIAYLD